MNGFKKIKRRQRKKRNNMLPLIFLLFLSMGIGYAYLSSELAVSGSTKLSGNTWDIHFENLVINPASIESATANIDSTTMNIDYSADLEEPGDFIEYTVDIVNAGSIPGKISLITNTGITSENENYLRVSYTYLNGSEVKVNDIINPLETRRIKVKAEIPNNLDINLLPETETTNNFTFGLQFKQSEGNRIIGSLMTQTENPSTTFGKNINRNSFESITIADYRTPPSDAIASWDASATANQSIMAWYKDADNNGKYELYLGGDGGVTANANSSYAFSYYPNVKTMDMKYLKTSNTTDMSFMMAHTGDSVSSFEITGLENWDTSNVQTMQQTFWYSGTNADTYKISNINNWDVSEVKTMQSMFSRTGYDAHTWSIGDLSRWDVGNVENMFSLFFHTGYNDTNWSVGNLSNWDTHSLKNMRSIFSDAGSSATKFNIGNLGNWDVSKVETMYCAFFYAGYAAINWSIGNLSSWQTGKVTDMHSLFYKAGYSSPTFDIGNLNNWDVSKVQTFDGTFAYAGYTATNKWNIGDLSSWNTSSANDMSSMFTYAAYSSYNFYIGKVTNWNTSGVTNMSNMFYFTAPNATWGSSLGTLKVYANDISNMFAYSYYARVTINMYNNPTNYTNAFFRTSTSGPGSTINYTAAVTDIDNIIATKGNGSVRKGSLIT